MLPVSRPGFRLIYDRCGRGVYFLFLRGLQEPDCLTAQVAQITTRLDARSTSPQATAVRLCFLKAEGVRLPGQEQGSEDMSFVWAFFL